MAWLPAETPVTPRASAAASRSNITDSAPRGFQAAGTLKQFLFQPHLRAVADGGAECVIHEVTHRSGDNEVSKTFTVGANRVKCRRVNGRRGDRIH